MKFRKTFILMCIIIALFSMASICASDVDNATIPNGDAGQTESLQSEEILADDLKTDCQQVNDEEMMGANDCATLPASQRIGNAGEGHSLTQEDDGYVHIYVNASASSPGNGSKDFPYQNLSVLNSEFRNKTVLHIANGHYDYNNSGINRMLIFADVKFIGESAEDTIVDFGGEGIFAFIEEYPNIYFENIRLSNTLLCLLSFYGQQMYGGKIEGVNVTFENSRSRVTSGGYRWGGAICCAGQLELTNCVFRNNSADLGGAIFAWMGGELTNCTFIDNVASEKGGAIFSTNNDMMISDSLFIGNVALDVGGAICTEDNLSITHSNFTDNCASIGGAIASLRISSFYLNDVLFVNDSAESSAGAIYSLFSNNYFYNSHFINCSALIGGAICDLDSYSLFSNLSFTSNSATKGGAVYKMYNETSINASTFSSNQAHEGGGLYVDEVYSAILNNLTLNNNSADYGGDVYCLGDIEAIEIVDVSSLNMFNMSFLNLIQGHVDYDVFEIEDVPVVFDARYDMRDYGYLTEVKDQKKEGACWAFAAIAALESCILKASGTAYDFSEENLKNLASMFSVYGDVAADPDCGGNLFMSIGYFASWLGPVYEAEDRYSSSVLSLLYDAVTHIQNVVFLPRYSYTDNDNIKEAIMKYGAVVGDMYYSDEYLNDDGVSYYLDAQGFTINHSITIVGWDDNYPKEKFKSTPAGDGAFIVRNSWGPDWGENGYFYVSYYDKCFAGITTPLQPAFTFVFNDTNRYDKNYQYETQISNSAYLNANPIYIGNSFKAEDDELISAVSTYFSDDSSYELSIFVNDKLKHSQEGNVTCGYFTIPLTKSVAVKCGDTFDVMFKITSLNQPQPRLYLFRYVYNPRIAQNGVSFYSSDGNSWHDAGTRYNAVIPIKGFTRYGKLNVTLEVDGLDAEWTVNRDFTLVVKVKDQYGDYISEGNVTLFIDGVEHTVDLGDHAVNKTIRFNRVGEHNITVIFDNPHYNCPSNIVSSLFRIDPVDTVLSLSLSNDTLFFNDTVSVLATVNACQGKVNFYVNDVLNSTVEVNDDGVAILILNNLLCGSYNLTAFFSDETGTYLNSSNKTSFDVAKANSTLSVDDMVFDYNDVGHVNALFTGALGIVAFVNDGGAAVDVNGSVISVSGLNAGRYVLTVTTIPDANHNEVTETAVVTVNQLGTELFAKSVIATYNGNEELVIALKDGKGNPLSGFEVFVDLDGNVISNITDLNGEVRVSIKGLSPKTYSAYIDFAGNRNYMESTSTANITVTKDSPILATDNTTNDLIISLKDSHDNPIGNVMLFVDLNGIRLLMTGSNGQIILSGENLKEGAYVANILFIGNENFNQASASTILTVKKIPTRLAAANVTVTYNTDEYLVVSLKDNRGNAIRGAAVSIALNGNAYSRATDLNGQVKLSIKGLAPKTYYAKVTFEENNIYAKSASSVKVTVTKATPKLTASKKSFKRSVKTKKYDIVIKTDHNKPLKGVKVTLKVKGKTYKATTNAKGKATFKIRNLNKKGMFTATVNFAGNGYYKKVTKKVKISVR